MPIFRKSEGPNSSYHIHLPRTRGESQVVVWCHVIIHYITMTIMIIDHVMYDASYKNFHFNVRCSTRTYLYALFQTTAAAIFQLSRIFMKCNYVKGTLPSFIRIASSLLLHLISWRFVKVEKLRQHFATHVWTLKWKAVVVGLLEYILVDYLSKFIDVIILWVDISLLGPTL